MPISLDTLKIKVRKLEREYLDTKDTPVLPYKGEIARYCRDHLKNPLTEPQERIAELLQQPPYRVLVPSANNQGKCVYNLDRVPVNDGEMVEATDLAHTSFYINTLVNGKSTKVRAFAEPNELREVYEIVLVSGEKLRRTGNHPLMVTRGIFKNGHTPTIPDGRWVECGKIQPGDLVAIPLNREYGTEDLFTDDEVKYLGYMIGDGGCTTNSLTFTQLPGKQLDEFKVVISSLQGELASKGDSGFDYTIRNIVDHRGEHGLRFKVILKENNLWGCHSRDKRLSSRLFCTSKRQQAILLNRVYATDGWATVSGTQKEIGFCSVSEMLCRDVQELLSRFGIRSCIRRRESVNAWVVDIRTKTDIDIFAEKISIYGKEEALQTVIKASKGSRTKWMYDNTPDGCRWEKVESVSSLGLKPTVAICVPETNTFCTHVYEHNTNLLACLASYWYDCYNPSVTLVTAPKLEQVTHGVFAELRGLRPNTKGFSPASPVLRTNYKHIVRGTTAAKSDGFQGVHGTDQLMLFDEATGVKTELIQRAENMFQGLPGHGWVLAYNPNDPSSYVNDLEEQGGRDGWHIVRLSALEHPNILAELRGEPPPIPAAIRLHRVYQRMVAECTTIPMSTYNVDTDFEFPRGSGYYWRPKTVEFEAQILGRWPLLPTTSLMSPLQVGQLFGQPKNVDASQQLVIACDVARFGADKTAIVVRRGPVILHIETHSKRDNLFIVQRLKELATEYLTLDEKPTDPMIIVDDTGGYGGAVVDLMAKYNIVPLNMSSKSPIAKYVRLRSALWFTLAQCVIGGLLDCTRVSTSIQSELRRDLTAPRYRADLEGRNVLEPKTQTKSRRGASPDIGDALAMSTYPLLLTV